MSRPRLARSVATRMREVRERNLDRFAVRVCWGRAEWRDVVGWERATRVWVRREAVRVWFTKIKVGRAWLFVVERRTWR